MLRAPKYFISLVVFLSYDPDTKTVARSNATIFNKLGIDYGLIGTEAKCCGEAIRKAGHEDTFQSLAQNNINLFTSNGVKTVVVSSPHCYHTLRMNILSLEANLK